MTNTKRDELKREEPEVIKKLRDLSKSNQFGVFTINQVSMEKILEAYDSRPSAGGLSVDQIFEILKKNHIMTQGQCDTDTFVVIPIMKASIAIHDAQSRSTGINASNEQAYEWGYADGKGDKSREQECKDGKHKCPCGAMYVSFGFLNDPKEDIYSEKDGTPIAQSSGEEAVEALRLILPLAKGYVANNQVGSNQKYIEIAEQVLSKHSK